MAMDMFVVFKASPEIKGETLDSKYKGEGGIDVLAWSWGESNSGSAHLGGGSGSGKVNIQDLSFTKHIDKASCPLMDACSKGTHIDSAKLVVRKAGGKPLEYVVMTLTDVLVSSYSTGGSGGEDKLTENVTLNFAKVQVDYQIQKEDGSGEAGGNYGWDIPGNVAL